MGIWDIAYNNTALQRIFQELHRKNWNNQKPTSSNWNEEENTDDLVPLKFEELKVSSR